MFQLPVTYFHDHEYSTCGFMEVRSENMFIHYMYAGLSVLFLLFSLSVVILIIQNDQA